MLDHAPLQQMLLHDFGHVVRGDMRIKRALRIDHHDRSERAQPEAAGFYNFYLVLQPMRRKLML